jgi:hypothetical protein
MLDMYKTSNDKSQEPLSLRLALRADGWEPLPDSGKSCFLPEWSTAEITPETIRAWSAERPDWSNTGIRCGVISAIDNDVLDPVLAAKVDDVVERVLGPTPFKRFGAKPQAMRLYRNSHPIRKTTITGGEGVVVEILGRGQQFAALGIHPGTGEPYAWPQDNPLTTNAGMVPPVTPEQLRQLARELEALFQTNGYSDAKATGDIELSAPREASAAKGDPICKANLLGVLKFVKAKDDRAEWIKDLASLKSTNLSDGDEYDLLDIADAHSMQSPGYEPGGYDELRRNWDSLGADVPGGRGIGSLIKEARLAGYKGGVGGVYQPHVIPAEAFAHYIRSAGDVPSPAVTHRGIRFALRSEAMQDARPPITWLIDGLLQDPCTAVIHAPWNSYKSFGALDIGLAVASGQKAFGHLPVNRVGPVIYLAGEGLAGIETLRRPVWRAVRGIAPGKFLPFYTVENVPQVASTEDVEACMKMVRDAIAKGMIERPVMIIIDTMARAMAGLNENDAGDATRYLDLAERLKAEFGCTVLTVAHEGKDGDRGLRGSSAFAGGFDIILKMDADTEGLTATLSSPKVKDGSPVEPFALCGREHQLGDGRKSLVFDWADRSDLHGTKAKTITEGNVGGALKTLGAEKGVTVTTEHLAACLAGEFAGDEKMVNAKAKALRRGATGRFRAYVAHHGKGHGDSTLWTLPTEGPII